MKKTLIDLFTSKKFLVFLMGFVTYIAGRFGFNVDQTVLNNLVEGVSAYLIGQGIADHGKEAAKIVAAAQLDAPMPVNDNAPSAAALKQAGFASVGILLFVVIGVLMIVSCAWLSSSAKQVEKDVIDCTTSSARDATKQFGPVVDALLAQATEENGQVNWAPVKDLTKNFGAELGGCVLSNVIAQALHPKPADPNAPKASQLVYDPVALRAGFEALRAEQFGGKTFKTDYGEL